MPASGRPRAGVAATSVALLGIAAMATTPLVSPPPTVSIPVVRDIRLAADTVPPGGILTSFLNNQVIYCSIICPLIVDTGVTAVATTVASPAVFLAGLQSGDVLKPLGAAAASVTGPTNTAATAAILADGTLVAPRFLNAVEVGVVHLLDVVPAAAGGLPGILSALEAARQNTFDAQHAPIIPNPPPTVMPHGVLPVAAVGALNIVGTVAFQGLNQVLLGVFATPDAVAQKLAATGNPVQAVAAGVTAAAGAATAAVDVVANSVVNAVNDVTAAAGHAPHGNTTMQVQRASTPTASARPTLESTRAPATTTERTQVNPTRAHPVRDTVSTVREAMRTATKSSPLQMPNHRLKDRTSTKKTDSAA